MESLRSKNSGGLASPFNDRKGHNLLLRLVPLALYRAS
jgi:hypothetical protein